MKKIALSIFAIFTTLAIGCSSQSDSVSPQDNPNEEPSFSLKKREAIVLTRSETQILAATNKFSVDFFKAYNNTYGGENTIISPLSLAQLLSMMANAVDEEATEETLKILAPGLTLEDLNHFSSSIVPSLKEVDNSTTFICSNLVWSAEEKEISSSFSNPVKDYYNAEVIKTPSPEAAELLNGWIEKQTNGLLKNKIKSDMPHSGAMLINAMYFKAIWANPFDSSKNTCKLFKNLNGGTQEVTMMNNSFITPAYSTETLKVARLPYGNSAYSLYAIMPIETATNHFKSFIKDLSFEKWCEIKNSLELFKVEISIPKFSAKGSNGAMQYALKQMGISKLFNNSHYTNFCTPEMNGALFIQQNSVFTMDEKGSEGASETHGMWATAPGPNDVETIKMEFNSPFVYLVEEVSTGAIIFIGTITKL